ncbi:MAG: M3 family oligoendopeptidase [Candidatus Binatia bacterium]|nr:M3 family oligoendopeptidase [Candidatus Binatia bacterium]
MLDRAEANGAAVGVRWNLSDLYAGPDDPRLEQDLALALERAQRFRDRYVGRVAALAGESLRSALADMEEILELVGRWSSYADLLHAAQVDVPQHGALLARTQEQASAVRQTLLFFELEWLALPDDTVQTRLSDPSVSHYRHFLEVLRQYRPHVLSEPEERILEEKANTGARAFARLFDELLARMVFRVRHNGSVRELNESEVLALLHEPDRDLRRAGAEALTEGLKTNDAILTFVYNVLVQDHSIDDRLRHYGDPMEARHLANEVDASTVEALLATCEAHYTLAQRYYRLKRQLLGVDELFDFDRYAPVGTTLPRVSWPRCREIVLEAYGAFSPRMREIAEQFFERSWIDAEPRHGKRGGAFSASTVPSAHPYILLSYTGQLHDVMTTAHELGHGVHQYLARKQGYLQMDTPLTMAETASVFGEMLVFQSLRAKLTDPAERLSLLCHKIEDTIATVFRQVVLTRFEQRVHAARRRRGELATDAIGELWQEENAKLYGDTVRLTDSYRWWWSYIPHFIHSPFYCYAYAFGELLVLALFELYAQQGPEFVPRYLALLEAGGSARPEELLRPFGIDVRDPNFWRLGMLPIERLLTEAEELASQR